jgi:nucleoside-diphosphate-sugar epimerase
MTNALVTGATGFVGQHVVMRLCRMGWNVAGMGRNESVGVKLEKHGIRFVRADLRDADSVVRACAGQDAVFHCGALSSPWGAYREFAAVNVDGTRHVAAGCRMHEVRRLIHISTPSIYFGRRDRTGVRECDPLPAKPVNAYAATKLLAERVVFQAFADGVPCLILRPRAIFGPLDRALFPRLLRANDSGGVPLIGGGNAIIDLTYVDNVVDAMLLGWEAPQEALGRAYNVTNGEPVKLGDALRELFSLMGVPLRARAIPFSLGYGVAAFMEWSHRMLPVLGEPPLTRYAITAVAKNQTLDITLARERLGYAPRVGLIEGLQAFAEWWKAEGQRFR